ncbi:MAG: AzlD domain-containing protein [Chloroflexales bacterium]|nr:AzlD domain-containing protein [Chloroflexales bacterium]
MIIWLTILGMAVATFAIRAIPLLVMRGELASWLQRWLATVPVAVFVALIVPPLVTTGDPLVFSIGPALPAGIAGALIAWRTRNVLLTIGVGMATFWALRWMGL